MADKSEELALDRVQVKKAVQALLAFLKTKSTPDFLLLDESQHLSLLFTLWKIPKQAQTIRIPLPHGIRTDTDEVCLFTRDEPNMTPDQTQRFYKKLLAERGVKNVTEVIPYKMLKTEYKPFEAKRRLLGNFDMFLSDDRVRRLLSSHIGKHFYERKKEPLSVNLRSKKLALDIQRTIQGTTISISKKGCCCMARVAHSGMAADEIAENIDSAVSTIVTKLRVKGPLIKIIHLKSQSSVALPIYTSNMNHLTLLEETKKQARTAMDAKKTASKQKSAKKEQKSTEKNTGAEVEEEIPQLVPIVPPSKKAKLETKKGLEKAPNPTGGKKAPNPTGGKKAPNPTGGKKAPNPTGGKKAPNPTGGKKAPNPTGGKKAMRRKSRRTKKAA
ncbi:ribosomal L1 domain-containing protein 1 isoform X3 [Oncorhynchus kisutch]|uniref:ribosomal L1 domain-containing protein 1 isoform X3 n=1 Tax=Oncorhynchus kisutch TaxID=8019 RepID=UPI0012DD3577|nr:ribosomal L1 domain-containing protein 1 isoform X3 [Oncorhynchus kisutch]